MLRHEPEKHHLREAILICFHVKQTAAGTFRMLVEANGDISLKTNTIQVRAKVFEDIELQEVIDENPCQAQK